MGATFRSPRQHDVMDRDWSVTPVTAQLKDKAWSQLGTSGSGNHFVEFGELTVMDETVGLPTGTYLALLSHSGSRGTGAAIAQHYSKLARDSHRELPHELTQLAWLDLSSNAGQEYWAAMELMGHYAAANHALIHKHMARALGVEVLLDIENHHNFAWHERHRLSGRLGSASSSCIARAPHQPAPACSASFPARWARPGYVVRGKGVASSLNSAAHGAGRRMSRTQAKKHVHVGRREAVSPGAWRDVDLRRSRRGADGLQGHRRGDGGAERSRRTARAVRAAAREDGAGRRAARRLTRVSCAVSETNAIIICCRIGGG